VPAAEPTPGAPSTSPTLAPSRRRPGRPLGRWLALGAAALLAAGAVRELRPLVARRWLPTGGAEWIWSAGDPEEAAPRAFYAVRELTLDRPPARARLLVQGDEEYLLYLNGRRVGSNAYAGGAPLDVYEVAPLLRAGANRLVAELRSGRGAGGFLLRLTGGDGSDLVVSDGRWRIFDRFEPDRVGGWGPLSGGAPPKVWGLPPVGRWGTPAAGPERPLYEQAAAGRPRAPVALRPLPGGAGSAGRRGRLWDWGREVTGYLRIEFRGEAPRAAQLFARGEAPAAAPGEADGAVLTAPGAPDWDDAVVRSFRYAWLAGPGAVESIAVVPVAPPAAARLRPPPPEGDLLGIPEPRRPTPVETAIAGGATP
jgi:hypothetical protein